jgi:hypothetical protein
MFIHSWMKVKAMAKRCEWTGVTCCVADETAGGCGSVFAPRTARAGEGVSVSVVCEC